MMSEFHGQHHGRPDLGRRLAALAARLWALLRALSGEDAYDRYLSHWHLHHEHEGGRPMDRKAFFRSELERKWNGVKRCC